MTETALNVDGTILLYTVLECKECNVDGGVYGC